MTTIAERLRELRKRKGMSQAEVAKLLGISRPAYVQYETGKTTPSQRINDLCAIFSVTADYILGNDFATSKPRNILKTSKDEILTKLSEHECKLIEKYRELSETAKIRVEARIDAEYDMMKEAEAEKAKDA